MELFFKWITPHLRIKKFYGNSENAVQSRIWIALSVYLLVAIVKKRLTLHMATDLVGHPVREDALAASVSCLAATTHPNRATTATT